MRIVIAAVTLFLASCSTNKPPATPSGVSHPPKIGTPVADLVKTMGQPDVWSHSASLRPHGDGYSIGGFLPAGPAPTQGEAVLAYWLDQTKTSAPDGKARLVFVKDGRVSQTIVSRLVVGF